MGKTLISPFCICLACIAILLGCSGNPLNPGVEKEQPTTSTAAQSQPSNGSRMNLGYYELTIYPGTGKAEMVPVRTADMHLNVTGILNDTHGVSVASVPSESDPSKGLFSLDVTLTHPISSGQFTGFDVMGILMTPGSLEVGSLVFANTNETRLLNADGYTRWWNPTEFTKPGLFGYKQGILAKTPAAALTATVNPYKYFANVLAPTSSMQPVFSEPLDSADGRGVFSAAGQCTRRYKIQFKMNPGPVVKFGYAIGASWAQPNVNPPTQIPNDFPITANQPEAYNIAASVKANSLYYDSETGAAGGVLRILMNVHDWQGQQAHAIADEVQTIEIKAPDLYSGKVNPAFVNETSLRAQYSADLTSKVSPTKSGDSEVVIRVESKNGPTYNQGTGPAPSDNISAFQTLTVNVTDPDCSADANNDFIDYLPFDLANPIVGQLCAPTDYKDYYRFEFKPGNEISGNLVLDCDQTPTRMELYDINETKIAEADVSGGKATIDLGALNLMPDQYYIRVVTQTTGVAFLYMLEFTGKVTDVTPAKPLDVTPKMLYFDVSWAQSDVTYAYFTGPNAFWIFDADTMSVDSLPISRTYMLSSARPARTFPWACFLKDYGMDPGDLTLMDMTDPASPVVYPTVYTSPARIHAVTMDSNYIYAAINDGVDEKLVVLDYISNPSAPVVVSDTYILSTEVQSLDMVFLSPSEKYLAVRRLPASCYVVDVSDPASPQFHQGFSWGGTDEIRDVATQGSFIYALHSNAADKEDLSIVEVTPAVITPRGSCNLTQDCHYIDVRGNYAYLTDNNSVITSVDVTNPDAPVQGVMGGINAVAGLINVQGAMGFVIQPRGGLTLLQLPEDSTSMGLWGTIRGANQTGNGVINGSYLYATQFWNEDNKSLISIDISDIEHAKVVGYLAFDEQPQQIAETTHGLVVGTTINTWWTVNDYDPTNMTAGVKTTMPNSLMGMTASGNYVYVSDWNSEITSFNVFVWPTPVKEQTVSVPEILWRLLVNGNAMYCLSANKVYVYSLVDPTTPVLEDSFSLPANAADLALQGNYLYVLTQNTLEVLDVSDPLSFVPVSSTPFSTAGLPSRLAVKGQFAWYGAYQDSGSNLMMVWPPATPVDLGKYYSTEWPTDVDQIFIQGNYYIDLRTSLGLGIFKMYP